jgi:hypothetical protein
LIICRDAFKQPIDAAPSGCERCSSDSSLARGEKHTEISIRTDVDDNAFAKVGMTNPLTGLECHF